MSYHYTIVPFGGSGTGKSTICNFLLDGRQSHSFKASNSTEGGETKTVSSKKNWALGDPKTNKRVQVFDIPGLADPDLPIQQWAEEVRASIPSTQNIDMAIMILKATDYRMDIPQIMAAKAMQQFLDNL
jgi:septin family protein